MKKYWTVFKNSLQINLAYRSDVFAVFFSEFLSLTVLIYLWISIYHQGNQIGGYSLGALIGYFVLSKFITIVVDSVDMAWLIGDTIREGAILNYLTKPINFLYKNFFHYLGAVTCRLVIYFFILFLIILATKALLPTPITLFYFFVSLFIAIAINYLIDYLIGVSTFYFGFIMGLNFIMFGIISFFSGRVIPIDLLPAWLEAVANLLPFKYIIFLPIEIFSSKIDLLSTFWQLAGGFVWIIILFIFAKLLYANGLKKYEAYSG